MRPSWTLDQKADLSRQQAHRGDGIRRSRDSAHRQRSDRAIPGAGFVAVDLPISARAYAAPGAAHAERRRRGADREVRPDGQRGPVGIHHPHQRRHPVAEGQGVDRRGNHARRIRVRASTAQLPNREDRKKVMDAFFATFKTYERTMGVDSLFAAQTEPRLRQSAQVSRFDHALSGWRQYPRRGIRHADRADQRDAADTAPVLPPSRPDARRAQLHYYDIYPPLVHSDIKLPYDVGRTSRAGSGRAAGSRLCRRADLRPGPSLDGYLSAPAQAVRCAHGRLRLRRASVCADELQRRLRVGDHHRARMGTRHAFVSGQQGATVRHLRLPDLHRRNRVDVQRGASAEARAEDGW